MLTRRSFLRLATVAAVGTTCGASVIAASKGGRTKTATVTLAIKGMT